MLALPLGEPAFGGFASDEDPSAYSDERWGVVPLDQLMDETLRDTDEVGGLSDGQRSARHGPNNS